MSKRSDYYEAKNFYETKIKDSPDIHFSDKEEFKSIVDELEREANDELFKEIKKEEERLSKMESPENCMIFFLFQLIAPILIPLLIIYFLLELIKWSFLLIIENPFISTLLISFIIELSIAGKWISNRLSENFQTQEKKLLIRAISLFPLGILSIAIPGIRFIFIILLVVVLYRIRELHKLLPQVQNLLKKGKKEILTYVIIFGITVLTTAIYLIYFL